MGFSPMLRRDVGRERPNVPEAKVEDVSHLKVMVMVG